MHTHAYRKNLVFAVQQGKRRKRMMLTTTWYAHHFLSASFEALQYSPQLSSPSSSSIAHGYGYRIPTT
jgi:hypothetical protein